MLSSCMYLSVDVGGVIKGFMADSEGLRSCCKTYSYIFDILRPQLIDLMRCVHTA